MTYLSKWINSSLNYINISSPQLI